MKIFAGVMAILAAALMAGERSIESQFMDGKPHKVVIEIKYGSPLVLDSIVSAQRINGRIIRLFPWSLEKAPVEVIEENVVGILPQ